MDSIECAKQRIREIIADSGVPEDPRHAENTLKWLFRLEPKADPALQIAALAHDIDRAVETRKVRREDFTDYNEFKISFFEVNMPLYYQREGWEETRRRCSWGYRRLSGRMKKIARRLTYEDEVLTRLLKEAIRQACPKD